jgi:hypothetical protein
VLNALDGFNLQPRVSIPFDGPIDPSSVTSETLFLVSLGRVLDHGLGGGEVIGINETVWDPETNTLYVKADQTLDQDGSYAIVVTRELRDALGARIHASQRFREFREELAHSPDPIVREYRRELLRALGVVERVGVPESRVAALSVFTTQSVSAVLEKIRDQIKAQSPSAASFLLGPNGERTVFALDTMEAITQIRHIGQDASGPRFAPPNDLPISSLRIIPGAVGRVAFGKYVSGDYETPEKYIPPVGTRSGIPHVQGISELYFTLILPSGTPPPGGWPVVVFGHGRTNSKNVALNFGAIMAEHGLATIAINVVGHGGGPLSTLTVRQTGGEALTLSAGGRGVDLNGDGTIDADEGFDAAPPRTIIANRDGIRQTVADSMQLVQVIEAGIDVDGNGVLTLDPTRIYYCGQSLGGIYGTLLTAVDPSIRAAGLNVPGGSRITQHRLSIGNRPNVGLWLDSRIPSLVNPPGLEAVDGVPVLPPFFNENMPLRNQAPVINDVVGALAIQEAFDNAEVVAQSANPVAYASLLRKTPLPGLVIRPVIFQFAKGDQTAPNPTNTAILRAGDLADRATFFRNDFAFAEDPTVPKDPHGFLIAGITNPSLVRFAAFGGQEQIAQFFSSDGQDVIHPEPKRFFEVPIELPLPEDLAYIPPGQSGPSSIRKK